MGMATALPKQIRQPQFKNTVVCQKCDAEYQPSDNWHKAVDVNGQDSTAPPDYRLAWRIPAGVCPFCGEPEAK